MTEGPRATLADAADEGAECADQGKAKRAKRKHDARSSEVAGGDESGGGDGAGMSGSGSIDYARQAVGLASLLALPDWPAGECTADTPLGRQKQQQVGTSSDAGRFTPASAAKPAVTSPVKREPAPPRAPSARARRQSSPKTDTTTSAPVSNSPCP